MKKMNPFLFMIAVLAMPIFLIAQTSTDHNYYDLMGNEYLNSDYAKQALPMFDTALLLSPKNKEILFDRAKAKFKSGLYASGISDYDSAILYADKSEKLKYIERKEDLLTGHAEVKLVICDKFSQTYTTLVPEARLNELYTEAELVDLFDKAIAQFPDSASAYVDRSNYYFKKGKFTDAIPDAKKAVDMNPSPENYYHLACMMYYSRDYGDRKIEKLIEKSIEQNASNGWSYYYRALYNEAYGASNKTKFTQTKDSYYDREAIRYYEKAVADYSKAIELNATPAWYVERARCKQTSRSHSDEDILSDYNKAVESYPAEKRWIGYSNRSDYYTSLKRYKEAIQDLDSCIATGRGTAFDYLKRARLKDKYGGYTNREITADLDRGKRLLHGRPMGVQYEELYKKYH